jgi:hypothetical protein
MYILASRRVVVRTGKEIPGGATFTTVDGKFPNKPKDAIKGGKTKEQKRAEKLAKMKSFNCGKKGHPVESCPEKAQDKDDKEEKEPPMAGMTVACCVTGNGKWLHQYHEICLDNGSQVNIVDSRLLTNLRTARRTYRSMNSVAHTERIVHVIFARPTFLAWLGLRTYTQ